MIRNGVRPRAVYAFGGGTLETLRVGWPAFPPGAVAASRVRSSIIGRPNALVALAADRILSPPCAPSRPHVFSSDVRPTHAGTPVSLPDDLPATAIEPAGLYARSGVTARLLDEPVVVLFGRPRFEEPLEVLWTCCPGR